MSIDDENCMVEIRDEEEEEEEEDPKELSPTELIRRQNEKWRQENEFTLRQLEATAPCAVAPVGRLAAFAGGAHDD